MPVTDHQVLGTHQPSRVASARTEQQADLADVPDQGPASFKKIRRQGLDQGQGFAPRLRTVQDDVAGVRWLCDHRHRIGVYARRRS